MNLFHLATVWLPVRMFAVLTGFLACTYNPAFAVPFYDIDTQRGFIGTNANDTLVGLGLFDVSAEAEALGINFVIFGSDDFENYVTAIAQGSGVEALAGEDTVGINDPITTTATAPCSANAAAARTVSSRVDVRGVSRNSTGKSIRAMACLAIPCESSGRTIRVAPNSVAPTTTRLTTSTF
jgi:hypothetical protein